MSGAIDFASQALGLSAAVVSQVTAHGEALSKLTHQNAALSLVWLDHLRQYELTGTCDCHVDGWRAAIVETLGCVAMGLVRPAIFGMRTQIDLALAWLYFKDHPVEWSAVDDRGEGFMLKGEVVEYLAEYTPSYKVRFQALVATKVRAEAEPYRLLSAHVHAQSSLVVPTYGDLATMVQSQKRCVEATALQFQVSEYISDILLAYFGSKWMSLPDQIVSNAESRLGKDAHKVFS